MNDEHLPAISRRNAFGDDPLLGAYLEAILPDDVKRAARPRLEEMGRLAAGPLDALAAEADRNPPRLASHDERGRRVDRIVLHPAYEQMKRIAYGSGIVGSFYGEPARPFAAHRHTVKFALGYLFAQAEQGLYCPICLTDGTARLVERYAPPEARDRYLPRLVSTDPDRMWQGAMYLTERSGGSDVGAVETSAVLDGGCWRLSGHKWFCSNAEADLALVLARPRGAPLGTKGLGLFAVSRLGPDGLPNSLRIERLKEKLGTRSMPTAEITLDGAEAELLGGPGEGFARMTEMLNLSRLYNAVASLANMRRSIVTARQWAFERRAFGRTIGGYPMVRRTLGDLSARLAGSVLVVLEVVRLFDRIDAGLATPDERRLHRILTPLAKLYTARQAVRCASECIEILGGCGYIEDWHLPRLLRDAQVLPIWEGTTNILALDVFRSIDREGTAEVFMAEIARGRPGDAERLEGGLAASRREGGELWTLQAVPWCMAAFDAFSAHLLAATVSTLPPGDARSYVEAAAAWVDAPEGLPAEILV